MMEEALKLAIRGSYEILAHSTPAPVVFKFEMTSINNSPLGRLIKMFSQVNSNSELIKELKLSEEFRNFCAHRAYVHEFMNRKTSQAVSQNDIDDMRKATIQAADLVQKIGFEIAAIRKNHDRLYKKQESEITSRNNENL